jgi:hypothetical protein
VCNGKRTRNLIEGYSTALQNFNDLHFVTLTIANVPFEILRTSAKKMNSDFAKIIRRSRDRGNVISALKTTEVTVRKTKKNHDSHPHFHIIVEGKKNAEYIRNEWIRIHPTYMVNSGAQKVESFANNGKTIQENLKEIFKYVTKLDPKEISIEDIDKIIVAMKGIQLIQTYGNIKKVDEDNFKETVKEMDIPYYENARWQYSPDYSDYIDYFTGMSMIHLIPIGDVLTQPPNPN